MTPKYLWAGFWAAMFYIFGKIGFDIAELNPSVLADGYPFSGGWYGNLLGQLIVVGLLTALFYRTLKKVHATRAKGS